MNDYLKQAISDIISVIKDKPTMVPTLEFGDATKNAIEKITELLGRKLPRPIPPVIPETPELQNNPVQEPRVQTIPAAPTNLQETSVQEPRVQHQKTSMHRQKEYQQYLKDKNFYDSIPLQPNDQRYNYYSPAQNYQSYARFRTARPRLLPALLAQNVSQHKLNHIFTEDKKETLDTLLKGPNQKVWERALSNELGRLAQGMKQRVRPTDTIDFIQKSEVPYNKKVTYANMVCDHRPLKAEPYRVRLTAGGDRLDYAGDASSPATTNAETKILFNSVISDAHKGARFISADLADFFLESTMEEPEFMRIHAKYFPTEMREEYDIENLTANDGYVYVKIKKGMYGLKQAAILAYTQLIGKLEPHGYFPVPGTSGIWAHKSRKTVFILCVDDFGIKFFDEDDKNHLLNALKENYKVTIDETGCNYLGYTIDWNYDKGYVDIDMHKYIPKARKRFQHPDPKSPQHAPHKWTQPAYGSKVQYAKEDTSPKVGKAAIKEVQSINGTILFYARAMDPTLLPACNEISYQQAEPTTLTKEACEMLLDFCATYPNAKIRFYASDMILYVSSDAAYLVLPNAKSRIAGHYWLSNRIYDHPAKTPPKTNGPIFTNDRYE